MPSYWNQRYYPRRQRKYRRRRFLPWRTRATLRRKWRRRRYRRTRTKVKKKRFRRKRTKIILRQFQPTSIKKCKIIGNKCIIQGSHKRCHHNFIQYYNSKVPELHPGGGGWSQLIFTLDSLYEDYEKMQNVWTTSNCNLPLVRYQGCTMKFYQTNNIDYIVVYDTCWPMVDTYLSHADASPTAMLLKKNKICIPSRQTQTRKKPYKKVFIKPPSQLLSKWYFQRDLCKTPLLMLTTTAMSFTNPFCAPKAQSNNITILSLSPYVFQNFNFQTFPQTSGWYCKRTALEHEEHTYPMYLYAVHSSNQSLLIDTITLSNSNKSHFQITPLCNPLNYQAGEHITTTYTNNKTKWGNIFYPDNLDLASVTVYISLMTPIEAVELYKTNNPTGKSYSLTKPHGPLIYKLRYNPETDKGLKNIAWIQSTSKTEEVKPPDDINLQLSGFPLYVLFWGWTDWLKKAKVIQDLDQNGIIIFKTDQLDTQLPFVIPIGIDFTEGYDPYTEHPDSGHHVYPSTYSQNHWYPKVQFQDSMIENICMSGPACPRTDNYLQAFVKYKFHFKWGGCPKRLEKACDPCSQPIWTTPDNIPGRPQITDPNTDPLTELYCWDWLNDYVKTEAIQRIQEHTETDSKTFISTDNKNLPPTAKKTKETETTQEETKKLLLQLHQLQQQRQLLQELLCNRLTTK
nr:MAG: ORF1 [TTV-like mini virus]